MIGLGLGLKPLVVLGALCIVSAGANLWQWRASALDRAACAADRQREVEVAIEQGRRQAAEETATRASLIATLAQADNSALLAELAGIADRGRKIRVVYRDRIRELPAPTCAPGAERMDAVNGLLGHD